MSDTEHVPPRSSRFPRARARWLAVAGAIASIAAGPQATAQRSAGITFHKDVESIFQRACQECHRPGSIAPMSLIAYKDVRPWVRSIKNRVVRREMPPWYIEKNVGVQHFKYDPSLSDAEIGTIAAWVDGGAVEGESKRRAAGARVHRRRSVDDRQA
jgi:mono/diheme cytochrome c family protein